MWLHLISSGHNDPQIHWLRILNSDHGPGSRLDTGGRGRSEQGSRPWNVDLSCACANGTQRDHTRVKEQAKELQFVIKMVKETEVLLQRRLSLRHSAVPLKARPSVPTQPSRCPSPGCRCRRTWRFSLLGEYTALFRISHISSYSVQQMGVLIFCTACNAC